MPRVINGLLEFSYTQNCQLRLIRKQHLGGHPEDQQRPRDVPTLGAAPSAPINLIPLRDEEGKERSREVDGGDRSVHANVAPNTGAQNPPPHSELPPSGQR